MIHKQDSKFRVSLNYRHALAEEVCKALQRNKMSASDLARALGTSRQYVSYLTHAKLSLNFLRYRFLMDFFRNYKAGVSDESFRIVHSKT